MQKKTPYTALFLVLLMLISNVGISMDVLWCHCTQQLKVGVFNDLKSNQECCKHKFEQVKETEKHSCCQKQLARTSCAKSTTQDRSTPKFTKECCSNSSQYLTLDQAHTQDNLGLDLGLCLVPFIHQKATTIVAFQDWILSTFYKSKKNNKAPPLPSGREILQAIQCYIC